MKFKKKSSNFGGRKTPHMQKLTTNSKKTADLEKEYLEIVGKDKAVLPSFTPIPDFGPQWSKYGDYFTKFSLYSEPNFTTTTINSNATL